MAIARVVAALEAPRHSWERTMSSLALRGCGTFGWPHSASTTLASPSSSAANIGAACSGGCTRALLASSTGMQLSYGRACSDACVES
eukprot:scaffold4504_cov116-Isochrysis_galbana.AAC.8